MTVLGSLLKYNHASTEMEDWKSLVASCHDEKAEREEQSLLTFELQSHKEMLETNGDHKYSSKHPGSTISPESLMQSRGEHISGAYTVLLVHPRALYICPSTLNLQDFKLACTIGHSKCL